MNSTLGIMDTSLPFTHLDDTAFNIALYELSHGTLNFNSDRLESLLYNPLDQTFQGSFTYNSSDPDLNLSFFPPPSDYMIEDEINLRYSDSDNINCFSLLHLNSRSLLGSFDKFKSTRVNLNKSFSVIGISETWLNDQTQFFAQIPGYNFVSNHRNVKTGGGIGLYLQDHFEFKILGNCYFSDPEIMESLFVEICIPRGKNIIVGTIYRPPNQNLSSFLEKFNELISIISKDNKHCYIMGDFNLDLLQEFMDSLFSHMFFPLITRPTCITSHSATLIDNIFTNSLSFNFRSGIILNDISDHLPVFALSVRRIMIGSGQVFQILIGQLFFRFLWTLIRYLMLLFLSSRLFDSCFPTKVIKRKKFKFFSPWITKGLSISVRKKNRLYKKFIMNPTAARESRYKSYKNKLNHLIRIAKAAFIMYATGGAEDFFFQRLVFLYPPQGPYKFS